MIKMLQNIIDANNLGYKTRQGIKDLQRKDYANLDRLDSRADKDALREIPVPQIYKGIGVFAFRLGTYGIRLGNKEK